ncbi:hypothetical protein [Streptomyces sp. MNU103]|uniref:hypothetical protein n=1 Tax=Streptomyces sp. MNU103 TaxID=2560024 RepID=UPI001E4AC60D|nr:hypothetical protein [Streptomyces sp. MNU103]
MNALLMFGPVVAALEVFPLWGPPLAVVTVVLLVLAARETWGTDRGDEAGDRVPGVPAVVPDRGDTAGDTWGDTCVSPRLACGDTSDPRVTHWPGGGR